MNAAVVSTHCSNAPRGVYGTLRLALRGMMILTACAGASLCNSPVLAQPVLTNLGTLVDANDSYPLGVSGDGAVVVGVSGSRAFRWTSTTGMQSLEILPGGVGAEANGVSADASTIVGRSNGPGNAARAVRWTEQDGVQDLGVFLPGGRSIANGASANGTAVVGYSQSVSGFRAFRWTVAEGLRDLGTLQGGIDSFALAISGDGSTVVGSTSPVTHAFRWTDAGGIQDLGTLPGGLASEGRAVSSDGRVVVGFATNTAGSVAHAMRWTSGGGMESLGVLPGTAGAFADGISGDGFTVVGRGYSAAGVNRAFIWISSLGMVDLRAVLILLGVDLSEWDLQRATAISADGSAIVGYGTFNGAPRGWIVRASCFAPPSMEEPPASRSVCPSRAATFAVTTGSRPLTYQWQWRADGTAAWLDVADGVNNDPPPASPNQPSFAAAGGLSAGLTVTPVGASWPPARREFRAVVTNPCGSVTSNPATLTICVGDADCDGDTDSDDVVTFFSSWDSGEPGGDADADGDTDSDDIIAFFAAWDAGC